MSNLVAPVGRFMYYLSLMRIPILLAHENWFLQLASPQGWVIHLLTFCTVMLGVSALYFLLVEKMVLSVGKRVPGPMHLAVPNQVVWAVSHLGEG